jgi:hypothetical protein
VLSSPIREIQYGGMPDVIREEILPDCANDCEVVRKQLGFPMDREWDPFRDGNKNDNNDEDEDEEMSFDDD